MTQRIVIADDHALVRAGLRALLERIPDVAIVGEAADAESAMRLVETMHPDVVLLDIAMRHTSGLDAVKTIADRFPQSKVIILSMHANHDYVAAALRGGAAGYLVKDSAAVELELALQSLARDEVYLSPAIARTVVDSWLGRSQTSGVDVLTPRQLEVLRLLAAGRSTKEIALELDVSTKTVETHRAQLSERLGIRDLAGLVRFAIRHGLIPPT